MSNTLIHGYQANYGIKQFKRDHPNATHSELQEFKDSAWEAQRRITKAQDEAIEKAMKKRAKKNKFRLKI